MCSYGIYQAHRSDSSCPALCRASTSFLVAAAKTWMAGTSPAMTGRVSLLHPHVLGEIVIDGMLALVDLHPPRPVVAGIKHALEKGELQRPAGLRLGAAVAARHGVVEPAVRRAGIDLDRVAFAMAIEAVAEAAHVVERDHVIGLAENAENRALDPADDLVERFGIALAHLPLPLRRRPVPDERGGDRALRRQHQRMPSGLADARDGDFRRIDRSERGELGG